MGGSRRWLMVHGSVSREQGQWELVFVDGKVKV